MQKINNKSGFTLLEILVVVIIVGVLASVAMPLLFRNVERAHGSEALNIIGTIKRAIEGCAFQFGGNSATCNSWVRLDMTDPSASATQQSSHFTYAAFSALGPNTIYTITATRVSLNGGVAGDTITLSRNAAGLISKIGTTAFAGIQ